MDKRAVLLKLPPEVLAAVDAVAAAEHRSRANATMTLLLEALRARTDRRA